MHRFDNKMLPILTKKLSLEELAGKEWELLSLELLPMCIWKLTAGNYINPGFMQNSSYEYDRGPI